MADRFDEWTLIGPNVRGRQCGKCTLCCTLLPVTAVSKPANTDCRHLCSRGCRIYGRRPEECRMFSCRWLMDASTGRLRRPDKAGYVIDPSLDVVQAAGEPNGPAHTLPVIQIWIDPKTPDAHKDPALRHWLDRQGAEHGLYGILRWGSRKAALLAPPSLTGGDWFMSIPADATASWSPAERIAMLRGA